MNLSLRSRAHGEAVILELKGRISIRGSTLYDETEKLLRQGYLTLVLDLRDVGYIDACGLGQLLQVRKLISENRGNLTLVHPSVKIRKLLEITKLDTVFEIHMDACLDRVAEKSPV